MKFHFGWANVFPVNDLSPSPVRPPFIEFLTHNYSRANSGFLGVTRDEERGAGEGEENKHLSEGGHSELSRRVAYLTDRPPCGGLFRLGALSMGAPSGSCPSFTNIRRCDNWKSNHHPIKRLVVAKLPRSRNNRRLRSAVRLGNRGTARSEIRDFLDKCLDNGGNCTLERCEIGNESPIVQLKRN